MRILTTAVIVTVLLAGCSQPLIRGIGNVRGTDQVPTPVGIGPEEHEQKQSPCACIEIELPGGSKPLAQS